MTLEDTAISNTRVLTIELPSQQAGNAGKGRNLNIPPAGATRSSSCPTATRTHIIYKV
jgi:hypothetical protein